MGRSILVCDYNEIDGIRLAQEVGKLAYSVISCNNIESAIAHLESGEQFDLMLFSHRPPHHDGLEGIASVRRTSEFVGLLLVIDELSDETVFAGYQAGADLVLTRPVYAHQLVRLLDILSQ